MTSFLDATISDLRAERDRAEHHLHAVRAALRVLEGADTNGWEHGTVSGYTNHGCRCEECHAARLAYDRKRRKAAKA